MGAVGRGRGDGQAVMCLDPIMRGGLTRRLGGVCDPDANRLNAESPKGSPEAGGVAKRLSTIVGCHFRTRVLVRLSY